MRYLSLFSGIEAASVAFQRHGWEPAAFAEVDRAASNLLAHHYPHVQNLGDVSRHKEWPDIGAVDLICGGSPCQSFSVAGLRQGMADPRGNLALTYLAIVNQFRPKWIIYENVPGLLSSNQGRDFGSLIGGMAELGYGVAYRVLDAQYVRTRRFRRAVPQRRRRVFVVGYLGDWRRAAAVLFDRESLSGHPPPRREAGQKPAPTLAARTAGGGGLGTDFDCDGGLIPEVCNALAARDAKQPRAEDGVGIIPVAHALRGEGFDASEDGTGRGTPLVPVAFDCKGTEVQHSEGVAPPLRSMGHMNSHQNAGGHAAVAFQDRFRGDDGRGYSRPPAVVEHVTGSLETVKPWNVATPWAVRRLTPRECERLMGFPDDYTDVPVGNRRSADGPRYKQLGNSWAVNCVDWIAERLTEVDQWP